MNEVAMFVKAGKDREVALHTLLDMGGKEIGEKIAKRLMLNGAMTKMGMLVPSEIDALALRVAAYMGWLPEEATVEEPK